MYAAPGCRRGAIIISLLTHPNTSITRCDYPLEAQIHEIRSLHTTAIDEASSSRMAGGTTSLDSVGAFYWDSTLSSFSVPLGGGRWASIIKEGVTGLPTHGAS